MSEFENEIAEMIIEVLNLEDISVKDIEPEAPLFNEGLSLDSIDALELALAISQRYGFQVKADDADNKNIFSSLHALAGHIEANRAG
ncbi:MAG TPA: acyl carrier protein [Gammaproteobacteria bacterium]|nr:acyl carrier protein [bacterium BMS3Abin11]HDH15210.1 acyl carrier protein [Gammaproteobacteria bacterium]HDZ78282.1 acyl carrier protein [Gammaproteobacteria bacterium]